MPNSLKARKDEVFNTKKWQDYLYDQKVENGKIIKKERVLKNRWAHGCINVDGPENPFTETFKDERIKMLKKEKFDKYRLENKLDRQTRHVVTDKNVEFHNINWDEKRGKSFPKYHEYWMIRKPVEKE